MRVLSTLLACSCLLASPGVLSAQPATRAIFGSITDQSGAALPGAVVSLGASDGPTREVVADGLGAFRFEDVPPGEYLLIARLSGFRSVETPVAVGDDDLALSPLVLEVGGFAEQVSVTATREERQLAAVPSSVGVVSSSQIEAGRTVNLAEPLKAVPGVYAGDVSGVDDLRITIRGSGVRATFGSRGVILMVDGVPITEPDGQTPHIDGQVDLASAERVEVVKGPASAVYGGAALGGVVNVITRPPSEQARADVRVEGGSYAYGKVHAQASGAIGDWQVGGRVGFTNLDGFREHNRLRNWIAGGQADWQATARDRIGLRVMFSDADLKLPGALNRDQFDADPSQSRPTFIENDWGRQNQVIRFGGRWDRQIGDRQVVQASAFGQYRDLFHPIFVVIDQEARWFVGNGRYRYTGAQHSLSAGVDVSTQGVDDRWFVNRGGQPTFQIRDDDDRVTNFGVYLQDEVSIGSRTVVSGGVRYDRITFDLVDLLFGGAASDRRTFDRLSPKVGAVSRVADQLVVYGNFSSGFETPTLGELRLPAGFNTQVDSQKAFSVEGGIRGQLGSLAYDLSGYRMRVNDEILPVTVDEVTLFRNVSETSHAGLELSAGARLSSQARLDGTYTYARFTLDEAGEFSGNRLPGIPTHFGTLNLGLTPLERWDVALGLVWAGQTHVDDANSATAPAYATLAVRGGYRLGRARLFVRGDNLTDEVYTNRVQVNDAGGFYFFPAPGRHASAGLDVTW